VDGQETKGVFERKISYTLTKGEAEKKVVRKALPLRVHLPSFAGKTIKHQWEKKSVI